LAELKAMGFKVCLWIHPYIGTASERFREGQEQGYFLKNPQGETYIVDMWGGWHPPVAMLDVTHPQAVAWFQDLLREPLRIGVDVYKTDFGEGIPIDVVAHSGIDGEHLHNLYALLYNDLVAQVTEEETGHSGLVWARSTYAGGQRHAAQWSGDINSTFTGLASTLRSGLSMAMCGHAFWSHDVGGFNGHPTPELYARWAQFGLFSPMVRAHGNSTRLPWNFGEEALTIFRDYARLRARLLPYLYTYACQAAETGLPLMRPLVLEFPDDALTYTMDLQYMLGEHLLVAPIYNASCERPVYLPEGRWIDFWSGSVLSGPHSLQITVPLAVLPLYVRANALLPTTEPTSFTLDQPFATITIDAYVLERGACTLRDTDGATTIEAAFVGNRLEITLEGVKRQLDLRLLPLEGAPPLAEVSVNGVLLAEDRETQSVNTWKRLEDGAVYVTINLDEV
jgi:alpha-D-xyloside xylohydrolase